MNKTTSLQNIISLFTILPVRLVVLAAFLYLLKERYFLTASYILFLIIILEGASLWSMAGLRKLRVRKYFKPYRLFPGEEAVFAIELENNKMLPVFLSWNQPLPPELKVYPEKEFCGAISGRAFLGWSCKVVTTHKIKAIKRGYYTIPALHLRSSDVFGLFNKEISLEEGQKVFIYPSLLPLSDINLTPADLIGEQRDNRPFLPDPIMYAGLKEYMPDIPARFIHWKASARQDGLLAKIIEPSANLRICIAINAEAYIQPQPQEDLFEEALSIAASLALWADTSRIPFGLLANAPQKELPTQIVVPLGGGFDQAKLVLESLARAELAVLGTLDELLRAECSRLPWGTTLVLIGGERSAPLPPTIRQVLYYSHTGGN